MRILLTTYNLDIYIYIYLKVYAYISKGISNKSKLAIFMTNISKKRSKDKKSQHASIGEVIFPQMEHIFPEIKMGFP